MGLKYSCPKCLTRAGITKYGHFKTKQGITMQRRRCVFCGTTISTGPIARFFRGMRHNHNDFYSAMTMYSYGKHIKDIAFKIKVRPNTIIGWIRKTKKDKNLFSEYLIHTRGYTTKDIRLFFSDFSRPAKRKRTRRIVAYSKNRAKLRASSVGP